ncbi:hypothetical protein [Pseudomonas sp. AN-1]|uniref:hypothetical protein n=1 Tax=Pseudomonas sp. AN-1 TaxID=3096605 RepID=UPI002A69D995|nr:hypothetical protein [Pseudomonas sp. AN-1]WPP46103.1 hypothetical protein SK095_01530 [Pseudomonas sp. AN-1]
MKRNILTICTVVSAIGIVTVLYLYGISIKSLVVSLIFLICPVLVLIQTARGVRQFDKDIGEAGRKLQRKDLP